MDWQAEEREAVAAAAPPSPAPSAREAADADQPASTPEAAAQADTQAAAPAGTEGVPLEEDALLQSLVLLTRHHGRERSAASLVAGQVLEGGLTPAQALRALDEAGFNAGLLPRPLTEIAGMLLPVVLLLRHGEACVLLRRDPDGTGDGTQYEVVMPGAQTHTCRATEAELAAEYTGVALAATPRPQAGAAHDRGLRDPGAHWLWGTLRRFAPYYRQALLAALLSNVLMLVSGLVMSVVFDKVIPNQAFVTLWALASASALALVFDLVARQLRSQLIDSVGKKADVIVGSLIVRQTLGVRMEHRPPSAGAYGHHLGQIEVVREFITSATLSVLTDVPFVLLFVAVVFFVGGPLGWVLVLAVPLILGVAWVIQARLKRSMSENLHQQSQQQASLVEAVEGLEDIKTAGAQARFLQQFEQVTAQAADSALRSRNLSSLANNVAATAQQSVSLVMLVWGVHLIADGVITGGALIGSVMLAGRAIAPLSSLVQLATRYQGARAAMVQLDRLMAVPLERESGRNYVVQPKVSGRLGLHEVIFAYPPPEEGQPAPRVLKGVNLKIQAGERVAILGRIGSGKSTILRLLAGLYQPVEGMVEVDGVDLRQIDPVDYRASVGFVSQEPRLFAGTLRENVTMGRPGIDSQRLVAVARLTGLERVAAGHPSGWDLPVGEMGALLSGGQRQLVALARCLVMQPQIVLMDEPTSSMDAQSEVMFLRQMKEAVGPCTLVMVTHRPAVLELVERIVVVDGGRVVMDGPKAAVLAALSGARPAASQQTPGAQGPPNLHQHPATQPVALDVAV